MGSHARWLYWVIAAASCSKPATSPPKSLGEAGAPSVAPAAEAPLVKSKLPPLPSLTNVATTVAGESVHLTFDPVDGAQDYRVYPLPADQDISLGEGGAVSAKNAVYRCAGRRQSPAATIDRAPMKQGDGINTLVEGQDIDGYTRSSGEATLGHVWLQPGPDRIPVYAMGDPGAAGDNGCYQQRWKESRAKRYVTSEGERGRLLKARWRDDGVAFYAPAKGGKELFTSQIHGPDASRYARVYFADGPEARARSGPREPAFRVLSEAGPDTKPLMRIFYRNMCGSSHDELVAGKARFERARRQGDDLPLTDLHWSGLGGPTTLVVEALDRGCPYQGMLAPRAQPAAAPADGVAYERWQTLEELRKASPTGEVFVNGQYDPTSRPRPIARSFVKAVPHKLEGFDWVAEFGPEFTLGAFSKEPCGEPPPGTCWAQFRSRSTFGDVDFLFVDADHHAIAPFLGELWLAYADVGADTGAKFRMTPPVKGRIVADAYLHVTMTVDSFSTRRRYPQLIISDQNPPVQWNLPKGNALIVQPFGDWPSSYLLEVCDHHTWDVNDQCPVFDFYQLATSNDPDKVTGLAANDEVSEHFGVDRSTTYDVYVSSKRAYLLLDGKPYGCANLPASGVPKGDVTVTFGDVLYHSGVDNLAAYKFNAQHLAVVTRRHFDNLGFKSGSAAPSWDETRLPCVSRLGELH